MAHSEAPTKEKRARINGEGDKVKFIGIGFEGKQVIGILTGRERLKKDRDFHSHGKHIFNYNDHIVENILNPNSSLLVMAGI